MNIDYQSNSESPLQTAKSINMKSVNIESNSQMLAKLIRLFAGNYLFSTRSSILGGGGRIKEQTYYYYYE